MVVFTICFLRLVAYLKDTTEGDPDLSFYGRSRRYSRAVGPFWPFILRFLYLSTL